MNQRQQRIRHLRNDSITSADQGAGGYRGSSYGGSSSSGDHRGNNRLGEALHDSFASSNNRSSEQLQRNYHHQQQQQQQHYHDAVENANFESYYSPQRRNGRHPQQPSRRAVNMNTARAGHRHQSLTLPITHKPNNLQENVRRQRGYGSYNETILNQSGRDINEGPGEEEDDDEFDNIPLVSSEYMKELTSRTPHSNMKNNTDESDRSNRLDPNNNSYRVLRQSVGNNDESDTGDNIDIDRINSPSFNMPGHRRRESDNSNQSSQTSHTRRTGWDRNIRQQRQLPPQTQPSQNYTHRRTSSSSTSFNQSLPQIHRTSNTQRRPSSSTSFNQSLPQIHRTSNLQTVPHQNQLSHHNPKRRASISGTSSPLFQKVDGHNGAFLRHSTGGSGGDGYDQGVIMPMKQQNVSTKNPKRMFESYRRLSSGDAAVAGVDDGGSASNVLASLTSDVSVPVNKRKKKMCLIAAIGVSLVVITIVATVVYFVTSQSSDVRSEKVQPGNYSSSPQTVIPEIDIALDCKDCISKPVSDIEGRCAPSNLPFSLSACEEACKDAACCYSDFDGDKCYDESNEDTLLACAQYKPHCDVLYRPWAGATDGIIPAAPVSLFQGSDWDEICGSGPTNQRKLSNYTETLTCVEFCLPAKCCFAPTIQSDLAGQGLVLSQDFAYQSLATAEYVMTSCTPKNDKSCSDYAEPCRDLLKPLNFWQNAFVSELPTYDDTPNPTSASSAKSTNKPTFQPTPQLPITVVTPRPSRTTQRPMKEPTNEPSTVPAPVQGATVSPSTPPTTSPTAIKLAPPIPIANLAEIKDSCTGMDNYNLIAKGEFNARTKCRGACLDGLCCYVDLGLGNEESCFSGNEDICAGYADCLVLKAKPNDVILQNDGRPPAPIDDLTSLCSLESIGTTTGLSNCYQACLPGSCCGAIDEASCFNEYEADCLAYAPCQRMADQYGGDSSISLPPIPPSNLKHACSYSSLSTFHQSNGDVLTECKRMCDVGMCCLDDDGCGDGTIAPDAELLGRVCTEYEPCRNLQQLPTPPDTIELMCQDKQSSECLKACEVASCCFSTEDNCFLNFELTCQEYIPYCAPNIESGDFPTSLSPPPPDLCTQGPPSLCRNTCQAASCCFVSAVEDNCFTLNEETCGMWAECAFLFQVDDTEFAN